MKSRISPIIKVVDYCNFKCEFCRYTTNNARNKMSIDLYKTIVEKTIKYNLANGWKRICVYFHGGEPLLWGMDNFKQAVAFQHEMKEAYPTITIENNVQTNGSLLNDQWIDFFKDNTQIRDAYQLILPMTKLSASAFKSMFDGCANLERAPQYLPATTLGATCYRNMFNECKKLKVVPVLPLATLASGAYQKMFTGCSILSSIKFRGTTWDTDAFYSVDTRYNPKKNPYRDDLPDYAAYWCDGVAAEGEIWLDQSLRNVANWDTTWGTIIPLGSWTIKYYGIDDVEQP